VMKNAKLVFFGDIRLADDNIYVKNDLFSPELKERVSSADVVCCNYEAPIIRVDGRYSGIPKRGPRLGQGVEGFEKLWRAGIDTFCLCNNHIMDYGDNAVIETIKQLEYHNCKYFGLEKNGEAINVLYDKVNERKIAFIAVAENGFGCKATNPNIVKFGYSWMLSESLESKIKEANEKTDFVVLMCHAGAEGYCLPLPELRELYRKYIDYGADIVIAHHPHVIQGSEVYRGKNIFYSLGNSAFDSIADSKVPFNENGILLELEIEGRHLGNARVVGTVYKDGTISESEDSMAMYKEACELLENEEKYLCNINQYCLFCYETMYKQYYYNTCGINYRSFLGRLKGAVKLVLGKGKLTYFDDLFFFHNTVIETHYWICSRAIRLKYFDYFH